MGCQNRPEEFIKKHDYLSGRLRIKGVNFNYHETKTSNLEAVFARGDRRVGRALEKAFRLGCKFDGWSEHLRYDLWEKAFDDTGIDMDFYAFRERGYDELLPWDIIDPLIDKEFLVRENEKAKTLRLRRTAVLDVKGAA